METINPQVTTMPVRSYGPGPDLDLKCPECGTLMNLSRHKTKGHLYYKCGQWPSCRGYHSAHPDGSPQGTPADAETRAARRSLHATFDLLWQTKRLKSRKNAYEWLASRMGKTKDECHIGRFTKEECEYAEQLIEDTFSDWEPEHLKD